MLKRVLVFAAVMTLVVLFPGTTSAQQTSSNEATAATAQANTAVLQALPFNDTTSFALARRGFMAAIPSTVLKGAQGNVIWDPNKYGFIAPGSDAPATVNPSLWRQSQLISISGLFEVLPDGIYQVRNYDLSNITFIEGEHGIIVIDPLISTETAKAALDLYFQHRPRKDVVAVIYTHSHIDHYGGVRGVVSEDDVKSGKVKIYAPDGFLEHAVAENVIAGNAMSRRASYMYGNLLPSDPTGQVGAGLGTTTSAGTVTLIPPTDIISTTGEEKVIDGLTFRFKMAPGTEAPSEMLFYIEELNALTTAEDATFTLHNTYSLRGAKIRDPLAWSKDLNWVIDHWGDDVAVLYAPHHWPLWGTDSIVGHLGKQRDTYRYIHDQVLRMTNQGYTMIEVAEMIEMPPTLAGTFASRGYYGSVNHDAKSAYVQYLGWFDGNPATLHQLTPVDGSKRYVEYMGGADAIITKAREDYRKGNYRWVAQVMNHVVFADTANQEAKNLEADALEQLGYQAESGPWRNFYLTGAKELREGVAQLPTPNTASPDMVRAMNLELLFDFLGVRFDGPKAFGKDITINFRFTDTNDLAVLFVENAALSHSLGINRSGADATLTLTRETLNQVLIGEQTFDAAISGGDIAVEGSQAKVDELLGLLVDFEFWFNIVTP
jgi:alkyl sulfatase BDS1-like metallo-beta-lactamase superfamily hydrolase